MKQLLLLASLFVVAPAWADQAPVADAGSLAVVDFFKQPVFRNAVLSPNGDYVAVVNQPDVEHQYVTLIDLKAETSTDIVASADKREYFDSIRWVSDDTVTFIDHLDKDVSKLVAAKWAAVDGGVPKATVTVWPGSYWILSRLIHDGSKVMLAHRERLGSQDCICLYRVDVNAGPESLKSDQVVFSVDGKATWLMPDKDGLPTVIVTTDEDQVRHYKRYLSDAKGGHSWVEFKHLEDRKAVFTPELYAPDGHDLYVFSNVDRNTTGYFEYDPDTDKIVRTLYANDDGDIVDDRYDPQTYSLTYVKWYLGTDPHYEILDQHARTYESALKEAFPGQQVVPWDISRDGDEVLVFVYSDVNPGAYYAFNVAKRQAELLGEEYPWLNPSAMAPVKSGSLKTHDGFTLNYLLSLPKEGHGPYPLVVVPHGGPIGVFNVNSFDPETQLIVSRGYAVLNLNYRGSGGSGKAFEAAGKHEWGRKIEDDIEEVVHAVMKSAPVDADRVCIYGGSYGGYSALMSVIRDPALFKCAASFAGVTDLPLLYDTTDVQFDKQVRDDMADVIGDPTTDAAQLRAVSPVYLADKIKRPIFLAQGGKDPRVDMEQAYRLKMVMEALKKPVEFRFYPEAVHGFTDAGDESDFYLRLLDFLGRNIASNRPVAPPPAP